MPTRLAAVLARYRAISIAALVGLIVIAWAWVLAGAGTGMVPQLSLAPPGPGPILMEGMSPQTPVPWHPGHYAVIFSMWWTMMVAMMLPSAAPTILLYGRVAADSQAGTGPAVGSFLSGYLITWGLFSLVATILQSLLERLEWMAPETMALQGTRLSGALLIIAGTYQLSPFKNACLRHCQSPAQFFIRHYRAGSRGAFRMGAWHGAICIGCCWSLMALLFVGGVMSLAWIALLTVMVAAEKLLPFGRMLSIALAGACLGGGGWMLLA